MITISQLVEEHLKDSPFIEEALSQDLINLSSLARQLQPTIQKKLYKDIQLGAIVMALKRKSRHFKNRRLVSDLRQLIITDITVRSNIIEYTFVNSDTLIDCQSKLWHFLNSQNQAFFTFSQGVFETTLFVSGNLEQTIEDIFKNEKYKNKIKGLSSITLILPEEAITIPGVYYNILKKLAWNGINFIEVVSSFTELTIFLENKNVEMAFSVLKNNP